MLRRFLIGAILLSAPQPVQAQTVEVPASAKIAQSNFWTSTKVLPWTTPLLVARSEKGTNGKLQPPTPAQATASMGRVLERVSEARLWQASVYLPLPGATGAAQLQAGGARAALRVIAPPRVTAKRIGEQRLFRDQEALVEIRVRDQAGHRVDGEVRLIVNSGVFGRVVRLERGVFRARYRPAPAKFPAFIPALAIVDTGASGVGFAGLTLAVHARVRLPGRTKRNVEVGVTIGEKQFGPVRSDRRGRFQIDVEVPPGAGLAHALSTDRFGNKRPQQINLHLPTTNGLVATALQPFIDPTGARATLVVAHSISRRGTAGLSPKGWSKEGTLAGFVKVGNGLFAAWYRAPSPTQDAHFATSGDALALRVPGKRVSQATVHVALATGPATYVSLTPQAPLLLTDSAKSLNFQVMAQDAWHRPIPFSLVVATAQRGQVEGTWGQEALSTLRYAPSVQAKNALRDQVSFWVGRQAGRLAHHVAFLDATSFVVLDRHGHRVPNASVKVRGKQLRADAQGRVGWTDWGGHLAVQLGGRREERGIDSFRSADGAIVAFPRAALGVNKQVEVTYMAPVPVDVRVQVRWEKGRRVLVDWAVITTEGQAGNRRASAVVVAIDGKTIGTTTADQGRAQGDAQVGSVVTVTHLNSGVVAFLRVPALPMEER